MTERIDLSGRVFGYWTVLALAPRHPSGAAHWICQCVCGRKRVVRGTSLRAGATRSCLQCATFHHYARIKEGA